MRVRPDVLIVAMLMLVAAVAAVLRAWGASPPGRMALVVAVIVLLGLAVGCLQEHPVALGIAFLVGLCWLWAAVAQGLQQRMGAGETLLWITWSIVVMVTSVRARPSDGQGLYPQG